jgi:hypothetical protein
VQRAKRSFSLSVQGVSIPTHGLSGEVHSCQSHRSLRVVANLLWSRMLKPPYYLGEVVFVHFTLHLLPGIALSPTHSNRL